MRYDDGCQKEYERGTRIDYRQLCLLELSDRIARHSDRSALRELHDNRPYFALEGGRRLLMGDYLAQLRDSELTYRWCDQDMMVVEDAFDLTLDKFLNLPNRELGRCRGSRSDGPDCRYYYMAFHDHVVNGVEKQSDSGAIMAEVNAAGLLQRLVTRHFYLSCLECKRRALKLVKRYAWRINGDCLTVWMPIEMHGSQCRRWLEHHIPEVSPTQAGEQDRVQAVIDRLLTRRRILSLDQLAGRGGYTGGDVVSEPLTFAEEIRDIGLAEVVAEEKADNIDDQRPAIRVLGREVLRKLILKIFESLVDDQYHAEQIAADFELSKATFSRFAGCQWRRDDETVSAKDIPDLWRNTAHVLASHADFVAVARQTGTWERVCRIVGSSEDDNGAKQ